MLKNVELCGYQSPTPIQAYCMPAIFCNKDIIAIAQTGIISFYFDWGNYVIHSAIGSGKTAAFLIPTISKLMGKAKKLAAPRPIFGPNFNPREHGVRAEPLMLIIAPTRELSVQIFDEARRLCYRSMLRPCVCYGGAPFPEQANELAKGCDILIGTPGRLMDIMNRPGLLSLSRVRCVFKRAVGELPTTDFH